MNYITKKILLPVVDKFISNGVLENVELIKHEISKTEEEIQRSQIEKLRILLLHSKRNSGYYKNVLPDENIIMNDDPTEIVKSIPLLTKSMIKENEDGLLTQNKKKLLKNSINLFPFYPKCLFRLPSLICSSRAIYAGFVAT